MMEANRISPRANAHTTLLRLTPDPPSRLHGWPLARTDSAENQPATALTEPLRAAPSRRFMRVLDRLSDKPMLSLEPVDFRGGKGAEGTSYLLSLVMERITEILKYILWAQWAIGALRAKEETCD